MLTEFDSRTFRNACGQFLTGVTVVTSVGSDGQPIGFTANSFSSVSLDPPLVLVCADKRLGQYDALTAAPGYAVHILSEDQEAISTKFAMKGADKFADLAVEEGLHGSPVLPDAIVVMECRTVNQVEAGDHTILIGQVERLRVGDTTKAPLGYFRGRYTSAAG